MDTIISVQDIRTSLGSIARRVEAGETFTVIRNSRPAFRIVPPEAAGFAKEARPAYRAGKAGARTPSLERLQRSFSDGGAADGLTPEELDRIIHEVHEERNREAGGSD